MDAKQETQLQKYIDIYEDISHRDNTDLQQIINSLYSDLTNTKQIFIQKEDDELPLTIIRRPSTTCLLWFTGGAFKLDGMKMNQTYFDVFDDCTILLVNPNSSSYKQSKENCFFIFDWIYEHHLDLNINPKQIFVGGIGSGAIYAMLLAQQRLHQVAYCFSFYPLLCKEEYKPKPLWSIEKHNQVYQLIGKEIENSFQEIKEMAPILLVSCKYDPYVNPTREVAMKLNESGIDVLYQEFDEGFHAFEVLAKDTIQAKRALHLEQQLYHYAKEKYFTKQVVKEKIANEAEVQFPDLKEDVLTEDEIEEISKRISMIPVMLPEEKEPEIVEKKQEVEPFSRDDVIKLLRNKEMAREKVVPKPYVEVEQKEDVYSNLKKIIEEDTQDSLKDIDELISKL